MVDWMKRFGNAEGTIPGLSIEDYLEAKGLINKKEKKTLVASKKRLTRPKSEQ